VDNGLDNLWRDVLFVPVSAVNELIAQTLQKHGFSSESILLDSNVYRKEEKYNVLKKLYRLFTWDLQEVHLRAAIFC